MNHLVSHRFFWLAPALLIAAGLMLMPALSVSQAPAKLPVIDAKKHESYKEKLTDRISFEMVAIPGGTFLMGSPPNEPGREADEGPQHPVQLKPFWIGKFEVTWNEYDLYWVKKPGPPSTAEKDKLAEVVSRPTPPYADETFGHGRENQPALCMTHHAAMEYTRWLSIKTGKNYRLPTEAEWEWACRAGTTTAYSFGDDPSKLGDYAIFADNSDDHTKKIGSKMPNPWGMYDMHGNVSEWCVDMYAKDYYSAAPADKITLQPVNLKLDRRYPYIARGGSWSNGPEKCRSAARDKSDKEWLRRDPQRPQSIWWMTDADFVGLRVVCPVEEQENLKGVKSTRTRETPD